MKSMRNLLKKSTSMLLVFAMLLGMCSTAFAAGAKNAAPKKTYVSLGDSMANGYGLNGYEDENGKNVNGYRVPVEESYPAIFAKMFGFEHVPMAISAMRAEDLHFILEFDYENYDVALLNEIENWNSESFDEEKWNSLSTCGDYYTWDEFVRGRFNDYGKQLGQWDMSGTVNVAEKFQTEVADADIISLAIGNANFGVFLLGRVMNALGIMVDEDEIDEKLEETLRYNVERALAECDEETREYALELYGEVRAMFAEYVDNSVELDAAANAVAYGVVSYVLNYAGIIERIVVLNPNAEIILVGLMNTMADMEIVIDDETTLPLGVIMNNVISAMNTYIAALPTALQISGKYENATFYFAEATEVEMIVETMGTEMTGVVRERIIEELNKMVFNQDTGLLAGFTVPGMDVQLLEVDLDMVNKYKAGEFEKLDSNKILSCAIYDAFEQAICDAYDDTRLDIGTFTSLMDGLDSVLTFSMEDMKKVAELLAMSDAELAAAAQDLVESEYMKWATSDEGVDAQNAAYNFFMDFFKAGVEAELMTNYTALLQGVRDGFNADLGSVTVNALAWPLLWQSLTAEENVEETAKVAYNNMMAPKTSKAIISSQIWEDLKDQFELDYYTANREEREKINKDAELEAALEEYCEENEISVENLSEEALAIVMAQLEADLDMAAIVSATYDELIAEAKSQDGYPTEDEAVAAAEESWDNAWEALWDEYLVDFYEDFREDYDAFVAELDENKAMLPGSLVQVDDEYLTDEPELQEIKATVKALLADRTAKAPVLLVAPKLTTDVKNILSDDALQGLLHLFARMLIGNGVGCHPSAAGHETLFNAVAKAYDSNYTAGNATFDKTLMILNQLAHLVAEYHEEAYEYGYQYALENGYIDIAIEALTYAETVLLEAKAMIEAESGEMTAEFKAELLHAFDNALDAIKQLKVLILEADVLDQATLEEAHKLLAVLEKNLDTILNLLDIAIDDVSLVVYEKLLPLNDYIRNTILVAVDNAIREAHDAAVAYLNEKIAKLEAAVAELKAALVAHVDEKVSAAIAQIEAAIAELKAAVENQIGMTVEAAVEKLTVAIVELIHAAEQQGDNAVEFVVAYFVEQIKAIVAEASHGEYVKDFSSYYVAIGDSSIVGDSYVDILAKELGVKYNNLGVKDLTIADCAAVLGANVAEIYAADLITIGFGNITMIDYMVAQVKACLLGKAVGEYDWSKYVTAEGAAYVEQALAELRAELVAAGLEPISFGSKKIDTAEVLMVAIESYAYSYVSYMFSYPELIKGIREINSDALIVSVGMSNALANVSFKLEGAEFAIGEYVQYLVDAANAEALAFAALTGETVFVDASDVETIAEANGSAVENLEDFLFAVMLSDNATAEFYASADGHAYIAEQIMNALTSSVVVKKGDVNGDGVVNGRDTIIISTAIANKTTDELTAAQFAAADVDGNGVVNGRDTITISTAIANKTTDEL